MDTCPRLGLVLTGLFLVLMSCAETPTSIDLEDANRAGADINPRTSLNARQHAATQAQGSPLVVQMPRQTVAALRDGVETRAEVGARIGIDADGTAQGELRWRSREDGRVVIQALTGRGIFDEQGALAQVEIEFVEANGERVSATVTPGTTDPDCLIWDMANGETGDTGTNNFPARVSFEASGTIRLDVTPVVIAMPRQTVDALRDGQPTRAQVQASIRIGPDGTAEGELYWRSREDGRVVIRALTGFGTFHVNGTFERAEIAFREANGERVDATVMADSTGTDDPNCLIWDLQNGETGDTGTNNFPARVSFEASTAIRVREASR